MIRVPHDLHEEFPQERSLIERLRRTDYHFKRLAERYDEVMARMRDLVQRTRAGRIRSSEMSDPTITVSSLGERGVEALYGIIYAPQVAIVGFGKVVARPWIIDGAIGPRSIITITLAADHRVSDGHAGALFLAEIGKLLQEPEKL